ncbi:MAG: hypothetical protein JO031_06215 [Ktedonobacteraceae bacterium]|nr:hypothetical protein [Ktedonobacteraceae bacterium]
MAHRHNDVSDDKGWLQDSTHTKKQSVWAVSLAWWYRFAAPPEPLTSANFSQREKIRRGRLAAIAIPIFILFLLLVQLQILASHNLKALVGIFLLLAACFLLLFLNRKGFIRSAGILALVVLYAGEAISLFIYPGRLTPSSIYILDFTIIPDLIVLAFFAANSLLLIFGLNVLEVWLVVVYAPHNFAITQILHRAPLEIFLHVYILQLFTALVLYIWARSTENVLARADWAEDIIAFERREKERRELELEQKRQLDTGIQQILQTHIAVANGDLSARVPLHQGHALWQIAVALNNLISRLQSLSLREHELRQKMHKEDERATNRYHKYEGTQGRIPRLPKVDGTTKQA